MYQSCVRIPAHAIIQLNIFFRGWDYLSDVIESMLLNFIHVMLRSFLTIQLAPWEDYLFLSISTKRNVKNSITASDRKVSLLFPIGVNGPEKLCVDRPQSAKKLYNFSG